MVKPSSSSLIKHIIMKLPVNIWYFPSHIALRPLPWYNVREGIEQCQNRKSGIRLLADGSNDIDFDRAKARDEKMQCIFEWALRTFAEAA